MLVIRHPASWLPERHYILRVIMSEFLGLDFRSEVHEHPTVQIMNCGDGSGKYLILNDVFFRTPPDDWLTRRSMPCQPLDTMETPTLATDAARLPATLPVIYGKPTPSGEYFTVTDDHIHLGLDIFGSAFFMLTRYEEIVTTTRDHHGRFPATASLAFQERFLERPIINEYVELLWLCLRRLFPTLRRATRQRRTFISHDVDWPVVTLRKTLTQVIRSATADVVKWRDPVLATRRLASWAHVQEGRLHDDVGNVFDYIMQTSERHNLTSDFYIIAGEGRGDINGAYTVEDPWIRTLLRRIHDRGHRIGIHPTYATYRDPCRTRHEYERLRQVCEEEGIWQETWGGRQHYLRWENPTTWQNYNDSGLDYDTTLTFADHVGFRCGVCYEYPVFHLRSRQPLALRERPLVVMDATLFGERTKSSMGMSPSSGVKRIATLKATCDAYQGDFTLLWHNNWLIQSRLRTAYEHTIQLLAENSR